MRRQPLQQALLAAVEGTLMRRSANIESGSEIISRGKRHHSVVRDGLRSQHLVVECRRTQVGKRDKLIGEYQPSDRLVLHADGPRVDHVPIPIGAVACLIQATIEIEIDSLGGH